MENLLSTMYINGSWISSISEETLPIYNPATNQVITEVAHGGYGDAVTSIEAAGEALPIWSSYSAEKRAEYLRTIHRLIYEEADRLAEIMSTEQGKPFLEARGEGRGELILCSGTLRKPVEYMVR